MHTRTTSRECFCAQIDLRKTRVRELLTLDENRRAAGLLNLMRVKNQGKNRAGDGATLVTTACPEPGT